jgi:hypothetical protein
MKNEKSATKTRQRVISFSLAQPALGFLFYPLDFSLQPFP